MRFDDRLSTVLTQPVGSGHDRVVRWRQLVDLVARSGEEGDRALLGQAIAVIRVDQVHVGEGLRAAAVRSIAGRPIPLALMRIFAADKLSVAAPLFSSAKLSGAALEKVREDASTEVAALLDNLFPQTVPIATASVAESERMPSISDVVARIEKLRGERAAPAGSDGAMPEHRTPEQRPDEKDQAIEFELGDEDLVIPPESPESELAEASDAPPIMADETEQGHEWPVPEPADAGPSLFRWESNSQDEIDWVDGVPRGALIGKSLAEAAVEGKVDASVGVALKVRAPFRDCAIEMGDAGIVRGAWTIGGTPVFAPNDGRFVGYRGVARRGVITEGQSAVLPQVDARMSHDALRELIHEIKTPLNAIIGFAEIIDGQYFGPAHRHYRTRASQIVANAQLLLQASEDLDFVARSQAAGADLPPPVWVSDLASHLNEVMIATALRKGVQLEIDDRVPGGGAVRIGADLSERLARRLLDAILGAAAPGERLSGNLYLSNEQLVVGLDRPLSIARVDDATLLHPEFTTGEMKDAAVGLGFSLRLVNGLASIAGGRLDIDDRMISLRLPTEPE